MAAIHQRASQQGKGAVAGPTLSRRAFLAAAGSGLAALLAGCAAQGPAGSAGSTASQASAPVLMDSAAQARTVTLRMVGDVLVHEGVWKSGEHADGTRSYDHLFAQVAPQIQAADLALANQETILGGAGLGLSSYPAFNSPQEIGDAEVTAGFDVVLGATNHALDRGMDGIRADLAFWRERHPEALRTGIADSEEAYRALPFAERSGVKVAVLNYTYGTNGISLPADAPFAVRLLNEETIAADVAAAREGGADIVVACPHWGTEYQLVPDDSQRHWAEVFAEQNVDAVIGTHPHVLEPVEVLSNAAGRAMPVFWSLGNFVSTQAAKERMVGGMAELTFEVGPDGCRAVAGALVPVVTHRASGTAFTTYPLPSYTEDLAAQNGIRSFGGCGDFSQAWCKSFCAQVLGAGFNADACRFDLAL